MQEIITWIILTIAIVLVILWSVKSAKSFQATTDSCSGCGSSCSGCPIAEAHSKQSRALK